VALGNLGPRCRLMILGILESSYGRFLMAVVLREAERCIHLNNVMMSESDILYNSGEFGCFFFRL